MTGFEIALGTLAGFALCWFLKDTIVKTITGTEAFVKSLEAKAAALKVALKQ